MKTLSSFGISSRFVRRIFYLLSVIVSIVFMIIVSVKSLQTFFNKSSQMIDANISSYKASNPISSIQQLTQPKEENIVQQSTPKKEGKSIQQSTQKKEEKSTQQPTQKKEEKSIQQATQKKKEKTIKTGIQLIHQPSAELKVLRALLTFYPNDQKYTYEPELRWLYYSWTEMMINESALWRTDLLVYTTEYEQTFKDLDCVFDVIRKDPDEKPRCRVFPYIRIKNRELKHDQSSKYQTINKERSQLLYQHLKSYDYIDSINTVFEYEPSYSMYNYVLRTDFDCFLTHNFAHYVPHTNSLLVGAGGYSTAFNNKRLKRIAHDMNWEYADKNGLGSTWYGPSSMTYQVANYTLEAMLYLSINEFTAPERQGQVGILLWPEWHYGVLLLYGGHLAINHLMVSQQFDIGVADTLLDQGVTSKDPTDIDKNYRLHLHTWHGHEAFSKFAFKAGTYNQTQLSLLPSTSSAGLAMRSALESKSMTLEQLKQKLLAVKK